MLDNSHAICKFYRTKQGCRFKDKCQFLHVDYYPPSSAADVYREHEVDLNKEALVKVSPSTVSTNSDFTNLSIKDKDEAVNKKKLFFPERGQPKENKQFNSVHSQQIINSKYGDSFHKEKQICYFYAKRGWCGYNKRCRFAHLRGELPVPDDSSNVPNGKDGVKKSGNAKKDAVKTTPAPTAQISKLCSERSKNINVADEDFTGALVSGVQKPVITVEESKALSDNCDTSSNSGSAKENSRSIETKEEKLKKKHEIRLEQTNSNKKVCQYFLYGYCRFGRYCKFSHNLGYRDHGLGKKPAQKSLTSKDVSSTTASGNYPSSCEEHNVIEQATDTNSCSVGAETTSSEIENLAVKDESHDTVITRPQSYSRDSATEEVIKSLNKTECEQLKKRLSPSNLKCSIEDDLQKVYTFNFCPTDPDWPFSVVSYPLELVIPSTYPLNMFMVNVFDNDDQLIPPTVIRCMEESIHEWLQAKQEQLEHDNKIELVFRPFLLWLDRNLEDIVTDGLRQYKKELEAKAAGFEFVPAKDKEVQQRQLNTYDEKRADNYYGDRCSTDSSDDELSSVDSDNGEDQRLDSNSNPVNMDPETARKGTEVFLRCLQLVEGISTLSMQTLAVTVVCERCRNKTTLSTPPARVNEVDCVKCNSIQRLIYRPVICHQFSSVIGYLDLDKCSAFDVTLQDCSFTFACEGCAKDMKGQTINPGQVQETWCRACHSKMKMAVESVRLTQLAPSTFTSNQNVHKVLTTKFLRVPKNPAIQEGKALPENGTCRHYKKSYRWFRFPCCGKCYPCDVCHEESEAGDHEMKLANRVICGHCAKEQPYSATRPCMGCESNMTKSRSSYWEGGKGCRDKVAMSRNDVHKFKNSNKKTKSNKAKQAQDKTKKTTKPKHS